MRLLELIARTEVEREPDTDAADMAELLVRIDQRFEARRIVQMLRGERDDG